LYEQIAKLGSGNNLCITGDPGIGKSAFSFYTFARLAMAYPKDNIYHVSVGGSVMFWENGVCRYSEKLPANWSLSDSWLLLDDAALPQPFANKQKRAIVFASPKKSNYHKLIKDNGICLYMPPWSESEVEKFGNQLDPAEKAHLCQAWAKARGNGIHVGDRLIELDNVMIVNPERRDQEDSNEDIEDKMDTGTVSLSLVD
jgi:hypothetical protein